MQMGARLGGALQAAVLQVMEVYVVGLVEQMLGRVEQMMGGGHCGASGGHCGEPSGKQGGGWCSSWLEATSTAASKSCAL